MYRFNNIVVRSYQDVKYISLPKDGANMVEIEDIGDVAEDNLSEYSITVHGAEVIGVLTLELYAACLVCKVKVGLTTWVAVPSVKCSKLLIAARSN